MLNLVAELRQHTARNIRRVLGNKVYADALRANQLDHLLNLVEQSLWRAVKEKVCLVEEKDHLGLLEISRLRKLREKLIEEPEHEGRIDGRVLNERGRIQNIHIALALAVDTHPVGNLQCRLAEELLAALALKGHQRAEYGSRACLAYIAVCVSIQSRIVLHIANHGLEILHVEEQ